MKMLKNVCVFICVVLTTGMSMVDAGQNVYVNGQQLNSEQIRNLERISCNTIPDGSYWLDVNSGLWGYAGNPYPQGYLTDNCYQQQRRPSLSERGLLYSPGELLR